MNRKPKVRFRGWQINGIPFSKERKVKMRHLIPHLIILRSACSQCNERFKDGAARHMLGYYPMEQFCTYQCVEKFLHNDHGIKRAAHLPPPEGEEETSRYI